MPEITLEPAHDPLKRGAPAELVEEFAPLGSRMRLETNSREVLEACRVSFGRYGSPVYANADDLVTVRICVDPDFTETPPWPAPVFRCQKDIFYVSVGCQNTAVAQLGAAEVVGFISPAMAGEPSLLRKTFLDCPVLTMLTHGARARYSYVHASAVAWRGRGILFAGPSGSGKSTTAYACARAGFDLVSDDVTYLRQTGADLAAWGRPWYLRLQSSALHLFPELAHLRRSFGVGEDVVEIDTDPLLPGRGRTACRPAAVFFLNRSEGPPRYEPLREGEALRLLSRDLMYDIPEALERHGRRWLELIRGGAYLLSCGTDPGELVRLLQSFLDATPDGSSRR